MMELQRHAKWHPNRVHVAFLDGATPAGPLEDRKYTVTKSVRTGHWYVSVGSRYNEQQISGRYTRWMRDEIVGEWLSEHELRFHVHVSGGRVYGRPAMRYRKFLRDLPSALYAVRYADACLAQTMPILDDAEVTVEFHSDTDKWNQVQSFGRWRDYNRADLWKSVFRK